MSRSRTKAVEFYLSRQGVPDLGNPPKPRALLAIVVSDWLTRYWILDRPKGLASTSELELVAARQFEQIFGDDASSWRIRVDAVPFAGRWLACALPQKIAIDLPRQAKDKGWQVDSLLPHFIHEYNLHCRSLKSNAAFCLASKESTTIGLIQDGIWQGIRVHPPLDRCKSALTTLLGRDCHQCGIDVKHLPLQVVGTLREAAQ